MSSMMKLRSLYSKVKRTCQIYGDASIEDPMCSPDSVQSQDVKDCKMHMILTVNYIFKPESTNVMWEKLARN